MTGRAKTSFEAAAPVQMGPWGPCGTFSEQMMIVGGKVQILLQCAMCRTPGSVPQLQMLAPSGPGLGRALCLHHVHAVEFLCHSRLSPQLYFTI